MNAIAFRKKKQKNIHLLISQENEDDLLEKLIDRIDIYNNYNREVHKNDKRTKRQIMDGCFEIIEI